MNEDVSDALKELEDASFTWGGKVFPCNVGAAQKSGALEEGGFAVESDLQIVARSGLFSTSKPGRGQTLTHGGIRYRIERVTSAPGGFMVLDCYHDARGA